MGMGGCARSAKPGRSGGFLWEEAATNAWADWQAVMCRPGRQKGSLVWGRSRGALAAGCPMLGSAGGPCKARHGGSRGPE